MLVVCDKGDHMYVIRVMMRMINYVCPVLHHDLSIGQLNSVSDTDTFIYTIMHLFIHSVLS